MSPLSTRCRYDLLTELMLDADLNTTVDGKVREYHRTRFELSLQDGFITTKQRTVRVFPHCKLTQHTSLTKMAQSSENHINSALVIQQCSTFGMKTFYKFLSEE
jgi:hypothetical protein